MCDIEMGNLVVFLICVFSSTVYAKATRFEIRDAVQRDLIVFISDAPLEKIIGQTNAVEGWVEVDLDNPSLGVRGEFEVDLRTIDTGMELRNEHFREKFMNTADFPFASLTLMHLKSPAKIKLNDQQMVKLKVDAELKMKGVSKSVKVDLRLTYFKESAATQQKLSGNLLRLSGQTSVDLLQFNVPWNESLRPQVSKLVSVTLDAVGTDRLPVPSELPPDGIKPKENKIDSKSESKPYTRPAPASSDSKVP